MKRLFIDILNPERRHYICLAAIVLMMFGLIWSRWLLSAGMGVLLGNAVLHKDVFKHLKHYFTSPWLLAFSLLFFTYLLSGFYSEDGTEWLRMIRLKLPMFFLPFSFTSMRKLTKQEFLFLLGMLVLFTVLSIMPVLWKYVFSFSEINESYLRAQVLPTPIQHIRYSILLAVSFVSAVWLYMNTERHWVKIGAIVAAIIIFSFMHLLAVRSGLLALYLAIVYMLVYYSIHQKRYWPVVLGVMALVLIPSVAYFALPTFQNKVKYVKWDMGIFQSGEDRSQYSDSRRLMSWQLAVDLAKKAPLLGVGAGDLRSELDKRYRAINPEIKVNDLMLPHNQWFYVLATTGFLGLILFVISQIYLMYYKNLRESWLYIGFIIILFSSFIAEASLEDQQISIAIYTLALLLTAFYLIPEKLSYQVKAEENT